MIEATIPKRAAPATLNEKEAHSQRDQRLTHKHNGGKFTHDRGTIPKISAPATLNEKEAQSQRD